MLRGQKSFSLVENTYIIRYFFNNTINWIANILTCSHQKGSRNQKQTCDFVVKTKYIVVYKDDFF